jgi:hypothetical protein
MGYCYEGRKLVCDACSTAGAIKVRCPFNWCQPTALCRACRAGKCKGFGSKNPVTVAKFHPTCEAASRHFKAQQDRAAALLAEGKAVRCSALNADGGSKVHVLFKKADGTCIGRYMSPAAYGSIPILEPATPEDYEALGGILTEAPDDFYGRTTKEVVLT